MAVLASRANMAPETDLGVVATTPITEQVSEQAVPEVPVELKSADPSDLPSIDAVIAEPAAEDSAGDMPVIEESEAVPASDGSGEDSSGS